MARQNHTAVRLRPERPQDAAAVATVHREAFGDHAAKVVALVEDLRATVAAGAGVSLVAVEAEEVVGHVMFTRGLLDAPRRLVDVHVLSPLAVLPARQRHGIGAALVRRGLQLLGERSVPLVFLEGDPAYYSRLGFTPGAQHGFIKPSLRIPDAAFQVFRLAAYESWMLGTLVYPDTFWKHDAVGLRPHPS